MKHQLLLHGRTEKQIKAFLNNPSHAVMVIGPAGAGKKTVARFLAGALLDVPIQKIGDQPYYIELARPEGKSEIPIDAVREMIRTLKLKTSGRRRIGSRSRLSGDDAGTPRGPDFRPVRGTPSDPSADPLSNEH